MIFAVHKRTKEHRVVKSNGLICEKEWYAAHGWLLTRADADGWIPWHGGECPLPDGEIMEAICIDGSIWGPARAGDFLWDCHWFIRSYRPILDADAPAEPEVVEWAIGERCIWRLADVCMGEHVILAKDGDTYWIRDDHGGYDMADREELRPIRTPAQRAENEAVEGMLSIIKDAESAADCCQALYRAGYRKQEVT